MNHQHTHNTKKAHHSEKTKRLLTNRLNRIEGQIRGINKMIGDDVYCDDILHQIISVDSALNGVKKMLFEAHMKSCIIEQVATGDTDVIDELMVTIGKMMK